MRYSEFGKFLFETGLRGAMERGMDGQGSVLFIDFCRVADKYACLNELALALAPRHLHVLDGRTNPHPEKDLGLASFVHPPRNVYYLQDWKLAPRDPQEVASAFPRLTQLSENFARLNGNYFDYVDGNIIQDCIETAYFFSLATIRMLAPSAVVIWNAFHPLSQAAAEAAALAGVPVIHAEFGLLPGTINIDCQGQMGESAVLTEADKFNQMPVDDDALLRAADMLDFLRETGMNRRVQHEEGDLSHRIASAAEGRPIVLFAGHNDFSSGVMPYDARAQSGHSPHFRTSNDAAAFMHDLAVEQDWLLVNKPHPFNLRAGGLEDGPNCLSLGDENINACIDAADVTVTVLSQTNYVSLIRKTPVVMLGRNQANGSGAVHVPETRADIADAIRAALDAGFSNSEEAAFLSHVARLSKSYLYRYSAEIPDKITTADIATLGRRLNAMIEAGNFADPFLTEPHQEPEGDPIARRRTPRRSVQIHESSEL